MRKWWINCLTQVSLPYRRKYGYRDLSELSNWDLWFSDAVTWTYLGMVFVMILVYNTDGKTEGRFHFFPFLTAVSYIFKRAYKNIHFLYV